MAFTIIDNRKTHRLELWLRNISLFRKIFYTLVSAAIIIGIATYLGFLKGASADLLGLLMVANVFILILLVLMIATRLLKLYKSRRQGAAGARFHSRLVLVFSFLAVTPTLVIYFMASTLFERGVQSLTGDVTSDALQRSLAFSQHINERLTMEMQELAKHVSGDMQQALKTADPQASEPLTQNIYERYGLRDLFVLNDEQLVVRSITKGSFEQINSPNPVVWDNLHKGIFSVYFSNDNTLIIAGYPLDSAQKLFLFISKPIDPYVPEHFKKMVDINKKYRSIEQNRWYIRFFFMIVYGVFALLSLFIAIGVGIMFADHIAKPIGQLVLAAQRIRRGDLDTRVRIEPNIVEFLGLAKAFNLMVGELQAQKNKLQNANVDIERRRNFIETTLKGLTSGVIGLDETNHIQVINAAAANILGISPNLDDIKPHIIDILPELEDLLYEQSEHPSSDEMVSRRSQKLIVTERNNSLYYLSVHIADTAGSGDIRKVITMDDITELHLAQKKAAWVDVARRVAHEIKNPLTPIQLAAERIKRKIISLIPQDDRKAVITNIETIIRQVSEIERIVKEFSQLSRMPQPVLQEHDVIDILKRCVGLQKQAYETIVFTEEYSKQKAVILCDDQLLGQAFSNILKNAVEALIELDGTEHVSPRILILLTAGNKNVTIKISDNGKGFPANMIDRFLEPYITTKPKGTGLGLAITKKIIDDHNGTLILKNLEPHGAEVIIILPFLH